MSARKLTTDELIAVVRRMSASGNKSSTGTTDADVVDILNEEMMSMLVPWLRKVREEYLVVTRRIPYVAGTNRYRIPERAVGGQLRNLFHVSGSERQRLERVDPGDLDGFSGGSDPFYFYVEGAYIVLLGESFSGELEFSYLARPGQLVKVEDARVITAVDTATKMVAVNPAVPVGWETSTDGFDIHSASSGAELKQIGLTRVSAVGTNMEFSEAIDGSVYGSYAPAVGDYVCLQGQAAIPSLPVELHIALAQAAVCRIVLAMGDVELLQQHRQKLADILQAQQSILYSRTDAHPSKIVSRNPLWGARASMGSW